MDYKEKYEEIIKKLKEAKENMGGYTFSSVLDKIIPELKESEGEKIRKEIISYIKSSGAITNQEWIAWLEKQGEQKPKFRVGDTIKCKHDDRRFTIKSVDLDKGTYTYTQEGCGNDIDYADEEFELVEQKPTDKVEPKFKVGDWVMVDRPVLITKVEDMPYNNHQYWTSDGTWFGDGTEAKLWTIQDAKDGDVLATDSDSICIFDGTVEDGKYPFAYCGLTGHYGFEVYDRKLPFTHNNDVHPATKEQRDLLFQKMKEAGYEWDAENKELKKIEQPSTAWSENDERMCKNLLFLMEQENSISSWEGCYEWLKSLKERMEV